MIWWISGALVVGSLVVLALAVAAVLRRLRLRVADVERSTLPKITALQEGAERLQEQVVVVQERADRLKSRRAGQRDS